MLADPINESAHRPAMLDIDADTALGRSKLWDDIKQAQDESDKSNRNAKFKAVQLGEVGRAKCYQEAVVKEWPKEGLLNNKITEFCDMMNEMGSGVWEDKAVEEVVVAQGDKLMAKALHYMRDHGCCLCRVRRIISRCDDWMWLKLRGVLCMVKKPR